MTDVPRVHDRFVGDRHSADGDARRAGVSLLRTALSALPRDGIAAATAATAPAGCRATRAALYDYVKGSLLPSRQRRVETHLDGCQRCTRAFIDVRETSRALRDTGRRLAARGHQGGRHRRRASRRRF